MSTVPPDLYSSWSRESRERKVFRRDPLTYRPGSAALSTSVVGWNTTALPLNPAHGVGVSLRSQGRWELTLDKPRASSRSAYLFWGYAMAPSSLLPHEYSLLFILLVFLHLALLLLAVRNSLGKLLGINNKLMKEFMIKETGCCSLSYGIRDK